MTELEVFVRLALAAVLAGYLYARHRQRRRRAQGRYRWADWTGKALDVSQLRPQVEAVRRRQLAGRQAPRGLCFHQALCAWTRQTVRHLAYFRDRNTESRS